MDKGSIKVSILYPNEEGKSFDMDYYTNKHIPMVADLVGDALIGASVEAGLGGGMPGEPAPYAAMGNLYFEDMEALQANFAPHVPTFMADVPNYTDVQPVVQISVVEM
jgi:uncharacterized protein (TIGR02118 family)